MELISLLRRLLDEISRAMEPIALCSSISRVIRLNRNERTVRAIKARLDDAYRDFLVCSSSVIYPMVAEMSIQGSLHAAS
jgi:hypothetical protein